MGKDKEVSVSVSDMDVTIDLDTPITRGETTIDQVSLRKPTSGELRGVSLTDLMQMDVAALERIIPRISSPTLNPHEVSKLDPADLFQLGNTVSSFLLPKSMRQMLYQQPK